MARQRGKEEREGKKKKTVYHDSWRLAGVGVSKLYWYVGYYWSGTLSNLKGTFVGNAFHIGFFWWVFGGCVVAITNSFVPLPLSDIWKRAIMMDGGTVCENFGSYVPTQQGTCRDIWIWAMAPSSATFRKWVGRARPAASGEMCLFREDWACLAASHL